MLHQSPIELRRSYLLLFPPNNPHYTLYEGDVQVASLLPSVECRSFSGFDHEGNKCPREDNLPKEWEKAYYDINAKGQWAGYVDSRGVEWSL